MMVWQDATTIVESMRWVDAMRRSAAVALWSRSRCVVVVLWEEGDGGGGAGAGAGPGQGKQQ